MAMLLRHYCGFSEPERYWVLCLCNIMFSPPRRSGVKLVGKSSCRPTFLWLSTPAVHKMSQLSTVDVTLRIKIYVFRVEGRDGEDMSL